MQHRIVEFMKSLNESGIEPSANIAVEEAAKALGSVIYAAVSKVPSDLDVMELAKKPMEEACLFMTETVRALAGRESIVSVTRIGHN